MHTCAYSSTYDEGKDMLEAIINALLVTAADNSVLVINEMDSR